MDGDNGFVLDQSGTIASELLSVALVALKAVSPVLPRRNGQKRDIQVLATTSRTILCIAGLLCLTGKRR